MTTQLHESPDTNSNYKKSEHYFFRFHLPHSHLSPVFGSDWFALKAEAFARFFGTPVFLIAQTIVVAVWILINALGLVTFDIYPFILLNLAFSTQAAYAAPLILLAQTRQPTGTRLTPWLTHSIARTSTAPARKDRRWPNARQRYLSKWYSRTPNSQKPSNRSRSALRR